MIVRRYEQFTGKKAERAERYLPAWSQLPSRTRRGGPIMADTSPQPWEQHPGESSRAFGAFCAYRDLGPARTLRAAAEAFYRRSSAAVLRQLHTWSAAFAWVERAGAWDRHLDEQARQAQEKARRDMAERHAQEARALQAKALERPCGHCARGAGPRRGPPLPRRGRQARAARPWASPRPSPSSRYGPVVLHIVEEVVGRPDTPAAAANQPRGGYDQ